MRHPRLAALSVGLALAVWACTGEGGPDPTTTSPTTTTVPPTTTTEPERCPDVFCLVYRIRARQVWSDGVPVTVDDLIGTIDLFTTISGPASGNPGYQLITGHEVIDDLTLMIAMSEVFGPWRTLFATVFPAHWEYDREVPGPTSGPFSLVGWEDGGPITLARNPYYSGPEGGGDVETIAFVVSDGVRDMVSGLRSGSYHLAGPTPLDWAIEDIEASEGLLHSITPGSYWEHITFNHSDPLLGEAWVRQAFAAALDREAILDATVRTLHPGARPLNSAIWMPSSPHHRENFTQGHEPESAVSILEGEGCTRGDDGIFVCGGRRMSFVWATTVGDPFRAAQLDVASGMLDDVGIEVLPWRLSPADLFSTPVFFGDATVWQIMSFAWKADPDPFLTKSLFECVGDGPHGMGLLNAARFCDPEVDDLVGLSRVTILPGERASILNQVDRLFLEAVGMIPLYQRPTLLAWAEDLVGPTANPWATDIWNVGAWTGVADVVVAVESEPLSLTVPVADGAAAMIMRALYQGAYLVNPDGTFAPALVEDVEVIIRGGG